MSEGTRFCWRCDEPITAARPGVTVPKVAISGGGVDIAMHVKCLKRPAYIRRTQ